MQSTAGDNRVYTREWSMHAAYPHSGHAQCVRDAKTRVKTATDGTAPNVERQVYGHEMGDKHTVRMDFKNGDMLFVRFSCLPDTIDPRQSKPK
jgi:hypothetical protein